MSISMNRILNIDFNLSYKTAYWTLLTSRVTEPPMLANHRKGKYGWGLVNDNDVDTAQSQLMWRGGWVFLGERK